MVVLEERSSNGNGPHCSVASDSVEAPPALEKALFSGIPAPPLPGAFAHFVPSAWRALEGSTSHPVILLPKMPAQTKLL